MTWPGSTDAATAALEWPTPSTSRSSASSREYAKLLWQIRQADLLRRRTGYYTWKIISTLSALAGGWVAFVFIGNSWWVLLVAAYLAVLFTQVSFLGHDTGHRQIFVSRRASYVAGILLGNLAIGVNYEWWFGKHKRHHAHPNTEGADPDIMIAALALTPGRACASRGVLRLMYRYQAYTYFPLLLLEAANLHVASIRALGKATRRQVVEAVLLITHFIGYFYLISIILEPAKAVAFIAVHQGLFGLYLGASFAPNHKGMPILTAGDRGDFLRRQVLTSRNVVGGWLIDVALGGLNYQIEHHLFPSMPRPNLRQAQPLVRAFCQQHEVAYCQASLTRSFGQALRHLNTTGRAG